MSKYLMITTLVTCTSTLIVILLNTILCRGTLWDETAITQLQVVVDNTMCCQNYSYFIHTTSRMKDYSSNNFFARHTVQYTQYVVPR